MKDRANPKYVRWLVSQGWTDRGSEGWFPARWRSPDGLYFDSTTSAINFQVKENERMLAALNDLTLGDVS